MVSFIGMLTLIHPFATTWHFPSRGNKKFEEKNRESYTSCTTPAFSPLVAPDRGCICRRQIIQQNAYFAI